MNNPLRQYFRRPALYITLPSKGKFYPEGAIEITTNNELPVFPMTAIDEITSKTPDALFNGTAMADLIKSCVPNIKDPWSIPLVDLETILIGIRTATHGNDIDIESTCDECEETSKYGVNLISFLPSITAEGYDDPLNSGELTFTFVPLTYRDSNKGNMDQFEIQKEISQLENIQDVEERTRKSKETLKKLTDMNVSLMANTIGSIATPNEVVTDKNFIKEFLESCDKNTFDTIRSHVVKLREDANVKPLKIKCVNCGHQYDQPIALNTSDFFA